MIHIVALKHIKQSYAIDNMFLRNDFAKNKQNTIQKLIVKEVEQ